MRILLFGLAFVSLALAPEAMSTAQAESRAYRPSRTRVSRSALPSARLNRARNAVYVGRRAIWRGRSTRQRVISNVRWSRSRDAVAFAARGRFGAATLVVVLVGGGVDGHVMRFPVPARARPRAGRTSVMWLGRRRVGLGRSPVQPDMVASWRVRQ